MGEYAAQLDDESFHLNGKDSQALFFTKTLASYLAKNGQPRRQCGASPDYN